jgi:hypothetical protein
MRQKERKAMNFFQRAFQRKPVDEATQAERDAAYQKGRNDGRENLDEGGLIKDHDVSFRRAYDRGRRDERARHPRRRGSPVLTTVLLLAACAGAFVIYLGVSQGSFTGGGQAIDQNLANAKAQAVQAGHNVANRTGDALEHAGQSLKQSNSTS